MARYRSAIIACGTIARCHARGWQGVPDVEMAAIADTHAEAREEFGEHFGVPREHQYDDYRTMLDTERPDFVDVCSWHGLHAEMVIAAAVRRPKAIISQKPMALSLGECDRMVTACAREGVKLVVGHQRRHLAGWLETKRQVDQGIIGTPLQSEGRWDPAVGFEDIYRIIFKSSYDTLITFKGDIDPAWTRITVGLLLFVFILLQKLIQRKGN